MYLSGKQDLQRQLTDAEKRVDDAMEALHQVDSQLGAVLQFTPEGLAQRRREHCQWSTLQKEWETLKRSQNSVSAEQSDKRHEHLTSDVRTMIVHAGDTSNLILDSDLDSYYLMDATLVTLPQAQDRLASIEKIALDIGATKRISDERRIQLAVASAQVKESDLDHAMGDFHTSLEEDQNFYGISPSLHERIPPKSEEYSKDTQQLLDRIDRLVTTPELAASAGEFESEAATARKVSFELWWVSVQELDKLLQIRIEHLKSMRFWALVITAIALLISFGIAAQILRVTIRSLNNMSEELYAHSIEISTATQEIASAAQSLASGASEQAASVEEIAASSEEIRSIAAKNSVSAQDSARIVGGSAIRFDEANRSLTQMVAAINEISSESNKISSVIKIIDEIAFQTNLLALNAAVEAARAGHAGMGFAVVADEVRNLAQRCAAAAKETTTLLEGSIAKAAKGKHTVSEVAAFIHVATVDIGKIKNSVDDVNLASQDQTQRVEQVAKALSEVETITQRNAAAAEQTASCVEKLNAQSMTLQEVIQQMKGLIGGIEPLGRDRSDSVADQRTSTRQSSRFARVVGTD